MLLLLFFVLIALVFSFLCSVAEAVILSVTPTYVALAEEEKRFGYRQLKRLKSEIHRPLAAILTLNTIAHTLGAAGAGAQAAVVFGDASLGVISAVLTLLILVFSEIIPKTLGATYWRQLAPATAVGLRALIWVLYPFVLMSEFITARFGKAESTGFSRSEIMAMADLSRKEGQIAEKESEIIKNLLRFQDLQLKEIMTPRTVVFSLPEDSTVGYYFHRHDKDRFSRIPIYQGKPNEISGFVLRSDLLLAQARGNSDSQLSVYKRDIKTIPQQFSIARVFEALLHEKTQMVLVVDEYGSSKGIVTLEDILETLIGLEIVDESDTVEDMQKLAQKLWRRRLVNMGLEDVNDSAGNDQ